VGGADVLLDPLLLLFISSSTLTSMHTTHQSCRRLSWTASPRTTGAYTAAVR
jgi:hypothetical protein